MTNNNYFRITSYYPAADISFIVDANGKFDAIWRFSSMLVKKGCKILEVSDREHFKDGNIPEIKPCDEIVLRACMRGKVEKENGVINIKGRYYTPIKQG